MLLLKKKLSHLLPFSITPKTNLISPSTHHSPPTTLLHFSTSSVQNPPPKSLFIIEYLINSCGFSSETALKASKYLTHITSPSKPDSVRHFLNQTGLNDTQIRDLITMYPRVLCARIEKTLKPKLIALQESGFSDSEITEMVSKNPLIFRTCDLRPKIEFWGGFFGTRESLLKAMKSGYLLSCNLGESIRPNISVLRGCGISDSQIAKMILRSPSSIARNPDTIKAIVCRADELGVSRTSGMFWYVFHALSNISKVTFGAKIDILKSVGWSKEEVLFAIRRAPYLLKISEEKIRRTMDFLVKEAGCNPSYIALHPVLLLYSLSGRLIPRCYILRILKSKELIKKDLKLPPAIAINEKMFLSRFVIPHDGKIPKLHEAYVAACAGRVPT